jgi:hypothetical protein
MLSQLVYVSNRKENASESEIDNIVDACKRNNPDLGITGVLLYSDKKFLQLVEGENKVIMNLYDKIREDNRHEHCVMLSYIPIKNKTFPSWHMGSKKLETGELSYRTNISSDDRVLFSQLLNGKEADGNKARDIIKKFFK